VRFNFQGTQEVYRAAKFLSDRRDGVLILSMDYIQTPFVIAISRKTAYFADSTILSGLLVDWQKRGEEIDHFFSDLATSQSREAFFREKDISYAFVTRNSLESEEYLVNIYSNEEISIYEIR